MRKRMLTRLGPEAAEAIDEFLDLALAYDRECPPSLQGFVDWLRSTDVEIKRDMEQERDEVRIMTVHGAKGLEAPIVFLPDTCMMPRRKGAEHLFARPARAFRRRTVGTFVWPAGGNRSRISTEAKAVLRKAESEEYHRLLYVAMTRARDRLYICGWSQKEAPEKASWYELVDQGLEGLLTEEAGYDGKPVRRLDSKQTVAAKGRTLPRRGQKQRPCPAGRRSLRHRSGRASCSRRRGLARSCGDAAGPYAEQPPLGPKQLADDRRFVRGRLVHTLLQHLPEIVPSEQERAAKTFVAARGYDLSEALRQEIVSETLAIVQDPRFAPLFQPGSLGEVPIVARIAAKGDLSGQIDRLAVLG